MEKIRSEDGRVTLPDGTALDRQRPRSAGILDKAAVAHCRNAGIALAYDAVQQGWVLASAEDDIDPSNPSFAAGSPNRPEPRLTEPRLTGPGATNPLRLRRWRETDVATFVRLLDNPRVWEHLPERPPERLTPALAWELISLSNGATHHDVLAIERSGIVVGQVRLAIEPGTTDWRDAEISYWIGEAHWGQGIASEAVAAMTERGFRERPGLATIYARVHEDNSRSARVLEKSGYREQGVDPTEPVWRIFTRARAANAGEMPQQSSRALWQPARDSGHVVSTGAGDVPPHSAARSSVMRWAEPKRS